MDIMFGFNTNVPYKGKIYHVQTEDTGRSSATVVTLLYNKGAILASKKTSYADLREDPDLKLKLEQIMKEQHKAMMKELIAGKHIVDRVQEEEKPQTEEEKLAEIIREIDRDEAEEVIERAREEAEQRVEAMEAQSVQAQPVIEEAAAPIEVEVVEEAKPAEKDAKHEQITQSLDDILLDHIIKRCT